MIITLQRIEQNDFATYGQLVDEENNVLCVTLEDPYVDANHDGLTDRNVSCIPAGTYKAFRRLSPKRGYEVFELRGVPGRSNCQIHRGQLPKHTEGCVLVGTKFGKVEGQNGIVESKAAFDRFMKRMERVNEFTLVVKDPDPAA